MDLSAEVSEKSIFKREYNGWMFDAVLRAGKYCWRIPIIISDSVPEAARRATAINNLAELCLALAAEAKSLDDH
jgi:hypothetical protein